MTEIRELCDVAQYPEEFTGAWKVHPQLSARRYWSIMNASFHFSGYSCRVGGVLCVLPYCACVYVYIVFSPPNNLTFDISTQITSWQLILNFLMPSVQINRQTCRTLQNPKMEMSARSVRRSECEEWERSHRIIENTKPLLAQKPEFRKLLMWLTLSPLREDFISVIWHLGSSALLFFPSSAVPILVTTPQLSLRKDKSHIPRLIH